MNKKGYISRIREDLRNGNKHSKTTIERVAKGFGIANKNLVKEFTELAIVLNARDIANDSSLTAHQKYLEIVALYQSQVNLSMRTSMSVLMQQYSTPAPISFLASSYILKSNNLSGYKVFKGIVKNTKGKIVGNAHLTNDKSDFPKYLEPSAGNGLLTIALPYHFTYVNELDDVRLANLKEQPFAKVSSWDALNPPMAYDRSFDGVATNPPFGSLSEPIQFGNFKIKRLEHAMALKALRCMKDNGKAAIIIGGHTTWDEHGRVTAGTNRIFLNYLHHFYNVEDIIPVNGKKLYSRQGTSINTRLILIDGAKSVPNGAAPLKNKLHSTEVNSHEELWSRVGLENSDSRTKQLQKLKAKAIILKQKLV
ncbi:MAG: class I SAM-dependent methyltransferase [Bacteroidales bacterium]|nr:class I SAM-dependent methyltransferase [Bacteroidales bacterium]